MARRATPSDTLIVPLVLTSNGRDFEAVVGHNLHMRRDASLQLPAVFDPGHVDFGLARRGTVPQ